MANIIDYSIFDGIILLQASESTQQEYIDYFITTYENQYLKHLLGTQMYFDFIANAASEKYLRLINGDSTVFEWNGQYYKYDGIKYMLGCLLYPHILEGASRFSSNIGIFQPNAENGNVKLPQYEMTRARNEGVGLADIMQAYILYKSTDYPLFCGLKLSAFPQ